MTDATPTTDGASAPDVSGLVRRLREARAAVDDAESAVADRGEEGVDRAVGAYRRATRLLDEYEDSATGTGDFQAYLRFQDEFLGLVSDLPEDVPARGAFEAAAERMDRRRLRRRDFDGARDDLEPVADLAALLDRREEARERLREARRDATLRLKELDVRADELADLVALTEADLDAPIDVLHEPIEAYADDVREEFGRWKEEAPARDVLDLAATASSYPLVDFRSPPRDVLDYVRENDAGDHPIPKLLDLTDYSGSKLSHYVDDPGALQTTVAVHRTALERLDAEPLVVSWPPPGAETLRRRADEVISLLDRFASEPTVAALRRVRDLSRRDDYDRLRTAASARDGVTDEQLTRLKSGAAEAELDAVRDAHDRLAATLDETDGDG